MIAINLGDGNTRRNLGSWAVLSAFITYPLYLQKIRVLGVYVVAFVRTLKNSAKFFPVFFIILTGFILSIYMNYSTGLHLGNFCTMIKVHALQNTSKKVYLNSLKLY